MGRPVNKRYFGNPATTDGNQFYIQADIGAGVEQCFIVKQRATRKFRVESTASGNQLDVFTVNGPAAITGAGFGYIEAGSAGSNQELDSAVIANGGTGYLNDDVLTVVGGTGTAATFTVQATDGVVDAFVITTGGDYSVIPTSPVATTGGTGGGDAEFGLTFNSTDDVYVAKLSNKNLIVHGGTGRDTYLINDPTKTRNVSGE